ACAATARCRTADSAWASSEWFRGFAGWSTFVRLFRTRGCSTGCTPSQGPTTTYTTPQGTLLEELGVVKLGVDRVVNESWFRLSWMSKEPRRWRGHAGLCPRGGARDHPCGSGRGRHRREHLRVHRQREAGIDRHDPRDGAAEARRQMLAPRRHRLSCGTLSGPVDERDPGNRRVAGHR